MVLQFIVAETDTIPLILGFQFVAVFLDYILQIIGIDEPGIIASGWTGPYLPAMFRTKKTEVGIAIDCHGPKLCLHGYIFFVVFWSETPQIACNRIDHGGYHTTIFCQIATRINLIENMTILAVVSDP